jgi:internalin A
LRINLTLKGVLWETGAPENHNDEILRRVLLAHKSSKIDLSGLAIVDPLPTEVFVIPRLKNLSLQENNISNVPSTISCLISLKQCRLYGNQLTSLPSSIGDLVHLEILWIHDNRIRELPPTIAKLSSLTILTLRKNMLTHLPFEMGVMTSLTELDWWANPLLVPPQDVLSRGVRKVILYLDKLRKAQLDHQLKL